MGKVTSLTLISAPALEDLVHLVDDPSGTPVSNKATLERVGGLFLPGTCGGRLTTESGVPISTSDRTAQGTIYFTPYVHNRVALYDGTRWKLYTFTERSLALSALTSGKNYDVFLYDNAGTLTLELSAAWTDDTTRADALTTQDGVAVKSGATTRLHLGTIRTTSTTTTEDSGGGSTTQVGGKRFVWNRYHQVRRHLAVIDTTDSWASANSTRQANNAAGNQVAYVCGEAGACVQASVVGVANSSTGDYAAMAVGVDSVSALSGVRSAVDASRGNYPLIASYVGVMLLGYHYLAWVEKANDTSTTFCGDLISASSAYMQSGLTATVEC